MYLCQELVAAKLADIATQFHLNHLGSVSFITHQVRKRLRENKPIGSGVVESACKTVVQLRCKRAGQSWEHEGGQAILKFRTLLLSNQLDTAWDFIASHYKKTEIRLSNNIIPFPGI